MTSEWKVPAPSLAFGTPTDDGAVLSVRRYGNPEGPRIILSHGNGLAAEAYYPFWSLLTERFDLFIYDYRSHGLSSAGDRRIHHVPTFILDLDSILRTIAERFGYKPPIGIFHSLSAGVALLHAQERGGFEALVLFDPPICPPGGLPPDMEGVSTRLALHASRRRPRFKSRIELADLMRDIPYYRRFKPGAVDLLVAAITRPVEGGDFELRCPREYEAQAFAYYFGWAMEIDLGRTGCPIKVIGADPTQRFSFMPSIDLSVLDDLDYDFLPETTHFLQMEEPEQCAALTVEFLQRLGLA
ncbi:MAG: alpha/beta hydrolase [Chloroflexota bacterium]|nr:alpha/beta hydrolase [Chloroflexota bacterium]MDE2685313.1 alpha/beta hydrolase [Chloroflexota bacterium]